MKKIFVSISDDPIQSTVDGTPIWIVPDIKSIKKLQELCEFYSCSVQMKQGTITRSKVKKGLVIGYGIDLEKEAFLYAHLTQRDFIAIDSFANLQIIKRRPEVLIISILNITVELLNFLYKENKEISAPGIIICYEREKFFDQIIFKAATLYCATESKENLVVDVILNSKFSDYTSDDYILLGGLAEGKKITNALSQKKVLMNVITHSDGIDAYLGEYTLCPFAESSEFAKFRSPLCIVTGKCYRTNYSIESARRLNKLISPKLVRSRILLWIACKGLRLPPSTIDPFVSLAREFLENPFIGCLITSWKTTFTSPSSTITFTKFLARAKTIGKATQLFNNSNENKLNGTILCILGDPAIRLAKRINAPLLSEHLLSFKRSPYNKRVIMELAFLRSYLHVLLGKIEGSKQIIISNALLSLGNYESIQSSICTSKQADLIGHEFRSTVVDVVVEQEIDAELEYISIAKGVKHVTTDRLCYICATAIDIYKIYFRNYGIDERVLNVCPSCGIISDKNSSDNDLHLKITGNQISLAGEDIPSKNWYAKVLFYYKSKEYCRSLVWPNGANSEPAKSFTPSLNLSEGPIYLKLILIADSKLSILRYPLRIEKNLIMDFYSNKAIAQ